MAKGFSVKDAKAKLSSIIEELNKLDDDTKFLVELDDNCGGSYVDDLNKFTLNTKYSASHGEVWLTNIQD